MGLRTVTSGRAGARRIHAGDALGARVRVTLVCLGALVTSQCTDGPGRDDGSLQVQFFAVAGQEIAPADRRRIETIARATVHEARRHLPQLPTPVIVRVQPGTDVSAERGEDGTTAQPNMVLWTVNPDHPGGVRRVAETWLRASLFHELHHLVRGAVFARATMLDHVVAEGLATAFERDRTGTTPPWGDYPPEAAAWVEELRDQPADLDHRRTWLWRHPDGRRWIAYRAGTYLADRATRHTGRSPADLVQTSTTEILRLAQAP